MAISVTNIHNCDFKNISLRIPLEEYLELAKQHIKKFNKNSGRLLKSDDAISDVATSIMIADCQWVKNYNNVQNRVKNQDIHRYKCASWTIQSYLRNIYKQKTQELELYNHIPKTYYLKDGIHYIITEEEKSILNKINFNKNFTDIQRLYIKLHFYENMSYAAIAKNMAVSRESVRQVIKRSINKLRKLYFTTFNGV